jgi:hypothetical protein
MRTDKTKSKTSGRDDLVKTTKQAKIELTEAELGRANAGGGGVPGSPRNVEHKYV